MLRIFVPPPLKCCCVVRTAYLCAGAGAGSGSGADNAFRWLHVSNIFPPLMSCTRYIPASAYLQPAALMDHRSQPLLAAPACL